MCILKFIKNNFFGIIILGFFLFPMGVEAAYDVKGDDSKSINNLDTGAYYIAEKRYDSETGLEMGTDISENKNGKGNESLYNSVQTTTELNVNRIQALRMKLKNGGSTVDPKKITSENTYSVNTKTGSIFIHKKSDGTEEIIGLATNDGAMYIPKNPVLKDSDKVGPESLDPKTGNGFLNLTDKDRGLEIGTSVTAKNDHYNKKIDKKVNQEKLNEATTEEERARKELEDFKESGVDNADELIRLTKAYEDARRGVSEAETAANQANNAYLASEQARLATANQADTSCDSTALSPAKPISSFKCIGMTISKVTNIMFKLVSFIAYVVGTLFDYSLEVSMNSAEFLKKLGVVEITWTFIRDILNMSFIFILLWAAIKILLGDEKYNARKILTRVIIVAILMNFSLFAAKLMVDGSNIVSLKLYEAMKGSSGIENKNASISARVMNTVGLAALYDITKIFESDTIQSTDQACANNPGALITISVMGSIFLIILCLALGLAGILFLIRLVNIIVLFIKSPLWVWGYVLPGSNTITKFKTEWEAEMKHVLIFPIVYLFWMLVAIIVFDKLGAVKSVVASGSTTNQPRTLLDLVCTSPGSKGELGETIALVAIFAIVIIFMMLAIKYALKNASAPEMIGGGLADSMSKKFAGYQTAMTKGLAKKAFVSAPLAVGGASVGAAKHGLLFAKDKTVGGLKRTGGAFMGGISGLATDDGFRKGVAEGFLNPGVYQKENLAKLTGKMALAMNGIPGSATLSKKSNELNKKAEEERKAVYEKRTAGAKEEETNIQEVAARKYKIPTQKEWEKKNGEIGTDTSKRDAYLNDVREILEKRADVAVGKGSLQKNNAGGVKHIDAIMAKAAKDITDPTPGSKIKIQVSNYDIESGLSDVLNYHKPGGDGAATDTISKKGMWKPFRTKKAEVKIKAAQGSLRSKANEHATEEQKKKSEEKAREKLKNIPEDKLLDDVVKNLVKNKFTGDHEKVSEIREINGILDQRTNLTRAKLTTGDAVKKLEIEEKIMRLDQQLDNKVEALKETRDRIKRELDKKEETKENK